LSHRQITKRKMAQFSTISTIIIEDVPKDRELLENILANECPTVVVIGYAQSAEEGYKIIKRLRPDLVFIDIQLERSTGFDMLRMLKEENLINFEMIFVTAFGSNDNETRAIDYSALDFIQKPPSSNTVSKAVNNAKRLLDAKMYQTQIATLLAHLQGTSIKDPEIIFDLSKGEKEVVKVNDVLYLEADSTITYIHLRDNRKLTAMRNLGHYSKMLMAEYDFFPVHNSIVVNKNEVNRINPRESTVTLKNGKSLVCSRRGFDGFKEVFGNNKGLADDNPLLKLWKRFSGKPE
jgi:two-component system, LytTR family, response regulator